MYAKSIATISKILDAAESLFVDKNYADVTMNDIAANADVTKGALYHHFESKDVLYLAMMHRYLAEQRELLESAVQSSGTSQERLRRFVLAFLEGAGARPNLMRLVRRDINIFKNPDREALIRAYQATVPEQVEKIIRDGVRDGELIECDARLLAWEHVAMVEVVQSDYAERVLGGPAQIADYVMMLFTDGAKLSVNSN